MKSKKKETWEGKGKYTPIDWSLMGIDITDWLLKCKRVRLTLEEIK